MVNRISKIAGQPKQDDHFDDWWNSELLPN